MFLRLLNRAAKSSYEVDTDPCDASPGAGGGILLLFSSFFSSVLLDEVEKFVCVVDNVAESLELGAGGGTTAGGGTKMSTSSKSSGFVVPGGWVGATGTYGCAVATGTVGGGSGISLVIGDNK